MLSQSLAFPCLESFASISNRFRSRVRRGICAAGGALLCLPGLPLAAQTAYFSAAYSTVANSSVLSCPAGVAVDGGGNVYIADPCNVAVYKFAPSGNGYSLAATVADSSVLNTPLDVAVDASGNVYITDAANFAVYKFATNGSGYTQLANVASSPAVTYIDGIALDSSGNVYVVDETSHSVHKFAPNGNSYTQLSDVAAGLDEPVDVAVDSSGNVYITDNDDYADPGNIGHNAVYKYAPNGGNSYAKQSDVADFGDTFPVTPNYLTVDSSGNVYVTGGAFVAKFTPNGSGGYTRTDFDDGAVLSNPQGIKIDSSGNLYVADPRNARVLKMQTPAVNFGAVAVGTSTPTTLSLTFEFLNTGTIGAPKVVTQGATGLDFTDAGTGTCTTTNGSGNPYNAGNTCTVDVNFVPQYAGPRNGAVELTDTSGNVLATAYVYGTGTGPQVAFNPGTASGTLGGGFNNPVNVALDGSGDVYVTDYSNNAVKEIPATCISGANDASCVLTLGGGFNGPAGVAIDGNGNVYMTDYSNNAVKEIPSSCIRGANNASCVLTLGGGFNKPSALAVDGSGNIYVTDFGNNLPIYVMSNTCTSSSCVSTLGAGFYGADGVAVDGLGNVYVSNNESDEVDEMANTCTSSSCVTKLNEGFNSPEGLAVDGAGNLYVTDHTGNVLNEAPAGCASSACLTTLSGSYSNAQGVALDGNGNVYVADSLNDAVKKISRAPASLSFATTIANSGSSSDSPQTVTLQNIGNAALMLPAPGSGNNPSIGSDFTLATGSGTCPVISSSGSTNSLAAGASCNFGISFTPKTVGTLSESLVLTDTNLNAAGPGYATQTIGLSGNGTLDPATSIVFTPSPPTSLLAGHSAGVIGVVVEDGYGNVETGVNSQATLTVTGPNSYSQIYNVNFASGVATFDLSSVMLTAAGQYSYTASGDSLGSTPFAETVTATSYAAPSTNVSSTSATQTITLYFTAQGTPSTINVLTLGAPNLDFKQTTGGSCSTNTLYTVTQTCTVNITFTPSVSGTRSGAVQLLDGSGNVLATAYLSGYGTGPQVGFAPNGAAKLAGNLNGPIGVAVDGAGNVFVADRNDNTVKEILAVGGYTTVNPLGGGFAFNAPYGLALDGAGNLFVADSGNGAIEELLASNGYNTVTAIGNNTVRDPVGVAVDPSGNVFVDDFSAMREIPVAGGYTTVNTLAVGGFTEPYGIAVDANSNVFVADTYNNRVVEITAASGYTTLNPIGSGLSLPFAAQVDGNGNVFVADAGSGTVKEILATGGYATVNTLVGGFDQPYGLTVDGGGNVYVTDAGKSTVNKLNVSTTPSVNFATLTTVGSEDTADGTQTVTVENIGNATLSLSVPGAGNNPSFPTGFLYDSGSTCSQLSSSSGAPYTLAVNASCTLGIDFQPTVSGASSGNVVLTDNNLNGSNATQDIAVSGTAKATPTVSGTAVTQTYGTAMSSTVTVAGSQGTPTGSITYSIDGGTGVTEPLSGGQYVVSIAATLGGGSHTLAVSYSGDSKYNPVSSATVESWTTATATVQSVTGSTVTQTYGSATSSTVTVTGLSGGATPTGTITYAIDGGTGVTAPLSGGQALVPIAATLSGGNHTLAVSYSGDSNYSATSSTTLENWTTAKSTVQSVAGTSVTQAYGTAASSTVTVTAYSGEATPTGSITYSIDGGTGVTASLSGGQALVPIAATLSGGNHTLAVSYSGDGNYSAVSSSTVESWTTSKSAVLSVAGTTVTQTYGVATSSTVTVTKISGGATPTGTITYAIDGGTGVTASLSGGQYVVPITATLGGGNHTLAVSYSGDGNYSATSSATLESWTTAKATVLSVAGTSVTQIYRVATSSTVTVTGVSGGATPTGTVSYAIDGGTTAPVPLSGGTATVPVPSTLVPGPHTIALTYNGDSNYNTSTGTVSITTGLPTLTVTANNATKVYGTANPALGGTYSGQLGTDTFAVTATTAATVSSPVSTYSIVPQAMGVNLSDYILNYVNGTLTVTQASSAVTLAQSAPATVGVGIGVSTTFSVTVTDATNGSTGTPTGTVQFFDGTTSLGTATLSSGIATLTAIFTATGTHSITAIYSGDGNFTASTSSVFSESVGTPSFTATATNASLQVFQGSATYDSITLTPTSNYQGTVSFSCAGLPQFASCSFLPASVTFTGNNVAQTVVLTLATTGGSASLHSQNTQARLAGIFWLPAMGLALLVAVRRKSLSVPMRTMTMLLLLAVGLAGLAGCGSGLSDAAPVGNDQVTVAIAGTGAPGTSSGNVTQSLSIAINIIAP